MFRRATMKILACSYPPPSLQTMSSTPTMIADGHHVTWELEPYAIAPLLHEESGHRVLDDID
jgi:hypothetical protein